MKKFTYLKRLTFLLAASIAVFSLVGCGQKEPADAAGVTDVDGPNEEEPDSDGKLKIAFIPKTLNNPFFIAMEEGAQDAADISDVELITQAAEREIDVEKQMQIMENMISKKVDAILISPSGSKEIVPAIEKANKAGIPVLILDSKVDEEAAAASGIETATFIGSDNYMGGQIAAEYVIEKLGGVGKIAVLEGIAGHESSDNRIGGFVDKIAEAEGIEIVSSQTANWERDQGFNVFQNMLTANPDIEVLFAASDLMALGAAEAIDAAGKTGEIMVIGFDYNDDAQEAIKEGKMEGSIAQFPDEMGKMGVIKAVELIKEGSIETMIPTKVELMTIDNMQ